MQLNQHGHLGAGARVGVGGTTHAPLTPQPVLYLGSDPSFPATAACLFKHLPCFVLSFFEQTFVRSLLYTSIVILGAVDTMGESPPSPLMQLTLTRGKLGGLQGGRQETNKQVSKQRKQFPPRGSRGQEASAQALQDFSGRRDLHGGRGRTRHQVQRP